MAALYARDSLTPSGKKMELKSFDILEAKADTESGTFEATVSVFNNVDSVGDRILPGAFSKSLEKWNKSGDPIPVILSHNWQDPWAHIGVVHPGDAKETERGLLVKGHLDIKDNEVASLVHRLMARRSLKEFSFGYKVVSEKKAKDGANELLELDVIEVGPTLKGANPATELHAVKSALEAVAAPPAPSEADIRRELEQHKVAEGTKDVPDAEPGPDPVEVLQAKLDETRAELEATRAQVPPPVPKDAPSQGEIRRELDRHRVAEAAKGLPGAKPAPDPVEVLAKRVRALEEALEKAKAEAAKPAPPAETDIRRELDRHKAEEQTKDLPAAPDPIDEVRATISALAESVTAMKDDVAKALEPAAELPPTQAEIERELEKHRVAEGTKDLPKVEPGPSQMEILCGQVDALKQQIEGFATTLDEKLDALEKAVEEPRRVNSADQRFRREARKAVVDLDLDGISSRKPPQPDPEPEREADWSLKARARREITQLLTES